MGIMSLPDGRFLIARRPSGKSHGGLWEFPGGKIDVDETPEQALVREFAEELDIGITIDVRMDDYVYRDGTNCLHFFPFSGRLHGTGVRLIEHEQVRFIHSHELDGFCFAPPDYEIVNRLKQVAGIT